MKRILAAVLATVLAAAPSYGAEVQNKPQAAQANAGEVLVLKTDNDRLSYALGADIARNQIWSKVQLDQESFMAGLTDEFSGKQLMLSENDVREAMKLYRRRISDGSKYQIFPGNVSYALGVDTARKLKPPGGIEFNLVALTVGYRDCIAGKKLLLDGNELRLIVNTYLHELKQLRTQAKMDPARKAQDKKAAGGSFPPPGAAQ
jgi:hypothetical protein